MKKKAKAVRFSSNGYRSVVAVQDGEDWIVVEDEPVVPLESLEEARHDVSVGTCCQAKCKISPSS